MSAIKKTRTIIATPETSEGKEQWNTRIHPKYRRCAKIVSAITDYSQDELAMIGLASVFGVESKDITCCRNRVAEAAKRAGVDLPVEFFTTLTR